MIADVNGVRVTPVRNPTIPAKIKRFVFVSDKCIQPANTEPTLAPALSDGAKMPPAAPVVNDNIEPPTLNIGTYHDKYFGEVNSAFAINSFPDPKIILSI